jgi:hypothetical protein
VEKEVKQLISLLVVCLSLPSAVCMQKMKKYRESLTNCSIYSDTMARIKLKQVTNPCTIFHKTTGYTQTYCYMLAVAAVLFNKIVTFQTVVWQEFYIKLICYHSNKCTKFKYKWSFDICIKNKNKWQKPFLIMNINNNFKKFFQSLLLNSF